MMDPHNQPSTSSIEEELAQVKQERDMLRALLDMLPEYAFARDTELRFIFSNKAHIELMGASSRDEVIGKKDRDFFPSADIDQFEADDRQALNSPNHVFTVEEPVTLPDGSPGWRLARKQGFMADDGRVLGLIGVSRDITEQKRAQAELERQQDIIRAQKHILDAVSVPVIPIADGIVILPLMGEIDSQRATLIMRSLLQGITAHDAEIVIIDITSVPLVDTGVAAYFNQAIQAAKLKGAHTILTGISEAVAETIVDLGIDWSNIETLPSLQEGLLSALKTLGRKLG